MRHIRYFGLALGAIALMITVLYRHEVIPVPLILLTIAEAAFLYCLFVKTWITLVPAIAIAGVLGWSVYRYHNAPSLYGTWAVAILFGGTLFSLLAPRLRNVGREEPWADNRRGNWNAR